MEITTLFWFQWSQGNSTLSSPLLGKFELLHLCINVLVLSLFAIAVIISKTSCWVPVAGNWTSAVRCCSSSAGCHVDFRSGRFSVVVSLFWQFSKLQLQLGKHVFPADLHGQTPRPFFLAHFDLQSQIKLALVEFINPSSCVASDMDHARHWRFPCSYLPSTILHHEPRWLLIQPLSTHAQPLPPPHLQCWKHVPAIFCDFQHCIGWGRREL